MKSIALRKLMEIHVSWIRLAVENRSLCHLYELQLGKAASIKSLFAILVQESFHKFNTELYFLQ
jgi:hypothetical protein